jgi:hypothetical protein
MGSASVVEAARRAVGPLGVFLPSPTATAAPADLEREGVRRLEQAGVGYPQQAASVGREFGKPLSARTPRPGSARSSLTRRTCAVAAH